MKKRILSLLLALCMFVSMLTVGFALNADTYNDGVAIYRYNLHSLQNGPYGANGYAPTDVMSIWKTVYGHSQNVASVYWEKTLVTPPTDGGPACGPYEDQYTDPFCYVGTLRGGNGVQVVWGDKAYCWSLENPNRLRDGYVMKIWVPFSDTYTFETNLGSYNFSRTSDSVEMFIAPASISVGNIESADYLVGNTTGLKSTTNWNTLQTWDGASKYLKAGEYYVAYKVPYDRIWSGSLTIRGTKAPEEMTLIPDESLLDANGQLVLEAGESITVPLTLVSSVWDELDFADVLVEDARVDVLSDSITAEYADGAVTITASETAELGTKNSASVYMVVDETAIAWCEIPVAITGDYNVGLATEDGAQIRLRDPQGLRFISTIDKTSEHFGLVEEFGTLLIPTEDLSDISELTIDATLNDHAVAKVPAVNFRTEDESSVSFTAVLIDILPENYKRSVTARAYAIMKDGTVVYGDTYAARSPYEVAENGLASETATDEEKAAFQTIIDAAQ